MAVTPISGLMSAAGIGSIAPGDAVDHRGRRRGRTRRAASATRSRQALDSLQGTQNAADSLAQTAATGNLTDIHNYTIAATEASLTTELTVAVRDRAVEAFNEIMRMQV